jgi:hypothetical protein
LSGAGRLTIARIDTIQSFYGLCIRQNKGDSKAMAKATKAIMYHYASTEGNPQHTFCPVGRDSWCSYQRDVANNTKLHKPIKNPFTPAIVEVLKPSFLVAKDVRLKIQMNLYTMLFGRLLPKSNTPPHAKPV